MTRSEKTSRSGWLFRESWMPIFRDLPSEQAGQLIKYVAAAVTGDDLPDVDPTLMVMGHMMVDELMASREKYEALVERNRKIAAARKGEDAGTEEYEVPFM